MSDYQQEITYALETMQTMISEDSEDEVKSVIKENKLIFPEEDITFEVGFDAIEKSDFFVSHMYVWIDYPLVEEPIYEMCSARGSTKEEAITGSVISFIYAAYDCLKHIIKKEWSEQFTNTVQGKEHLWHFCEGKKALMTIGTAQEQKTEYEYSLWNVIKDEIGKYLGALRCYWIKMYIGVVGNHNISEVRINDMRVNALSELLRKYADSLPLNGQGLYSEKQFFFIQQDELTYVPYPYSKQEIQNKLIQVLNAKWECITIEEDHYYKFDEEQYYNKIDPIMGNDSMLFIELDCFSREIAAIYAYQEEINFDQEIFAYRDGEIKESYYATQFTAYPWIFTTMVNLHRSEKLPKDLFPILIGESALGKLIYQYEEEHGEPIEALRGFGIMDDQHNLIVR